MLFTGSSSKQSPRANPEIPRMQQDMASSSGFGSVGMKQIEDGGSDFMSPLSYSSIFFHSAAPASSPSSENSVSSTSGGGTSTKTASTSSAINSLSRLMSEHQELLSRHALCLSQLRKTFKEAETLRQENTNLRIANRDLSNQLNLVIQAALQSHNKTAPFPEPSNHQYSSSSVAERFGGEKKRENGGWDEGFSTESPTSVIENDRCDSQNSDAGRVALPKSISVRSNGFLKMSQTVLGSSGGSSGPVRGASRIRTPNPVSGPQKVYVRGGTKKDGPIELEVYNQGMFKTELCNKWQETGTCPYGDHCQFAHGIEELRPVIRHPRYKTEVCRMVLSGEHCPYGHRCHFRHALSEQEKLMISLRLD